MRQLMINDIYPPVEVPDNSIYILIAFMVFIFLLTAIVYFLYKKMRRKNKKDEDHYLKILFTCDLDNAKRSAYLFTYYGRFLAQTKEQKKDLEHIITQLFAHKYQKKAPEISKALRDEIVVFLDKLRGYYA